MDAPAMDAPAMDITVSLERVMPSVNAIVTDLLTKNTAVRDHADARRLVAHAIRRASQPGAEVSLFLKLIDSEFRSDRGEWTPDAVVSVDGDFLVGIASVVPGEVTLSTESCGVFSRMRLEAGGFKYAVNDTFLLPSLAITGERVTVDFRVDAGHEAALPMGIYAAFDEAFRARLASTAWVLPDGDATTYVNEGKIRKAPPPGGLEGFTVMPRVST